MEQLDGERKNSLLYKETATGHLWKRSKKRLANGKMRSYFDCHTVGCSSTGVLTDGDESLRTMRPHSHQVDAEDEDKVKLKAMLRNLAATTTRTFQDIYTECQLAHPQGALLAGCLHECKQMMQRARAHHTPNVPKTVEEFGKLMSETR